jgi:hypothetical protein
MRLSEYKEGSVLMKTREKLAFRLKQVIIMNEGFRSQRSKYKILGYSEQVEKFNKLIEHVSLEETVLTDLIKSLYQKDKVFLRELEEKNYRVRKQAEESYYNELKKELNINE